MVLKRTILVKLSAAAAVFASALTLQSAPLKASEIVRLVVDVNEDIQKQTALVQCAFEKTDYKLEVVEMPWKRGQLMTKAGSVDGFFIAAQKDERDSYATHSAPVRQIQWLYVQDQNSNLTLEDSGFYEQRFSSMRGTRRLLWLQEELSKKMPVNEVQVVNTASRAIYDLSSGGTDVVLTNNESFRQSLKLLDLNEEQFRTTIVHQVDGGVYFAKGFLSKHPSFLAQFNKGAKRCRAVN